MNRPKFAIGEPLLEEGRVPVQVVGIVEGFDFYEPCYWVYDGSSRFVVSESWLSRKEAAV